MSISQEIRFVGKLEEVVDGSVMFLLLKNIKKLFEAVL